ncbi:putative protein phosphatase 2C 59 [Camellia lanceoleosa]|uniref:Uncharacterized protein n=1 Tax=Camellia lanceoleosa TaxID=1840588 RepID=A0ACC0FT45_9ERIC|nr:putative protein phosphatase 2C 59 [Camellia lanceoleosa]
MGYLNPVLSSASQVYANDAPVNGGGLSHNGKFSYGYASSPRKRSTMEDFYETRIDGVDGKIVDLFGVFDGHGADAYSHTDSEFLKSENNQNRDAGSTASTAILVGDRLLVTNVGDSRYERCTHAGCQYEIRVVSKVLRGLSRPITYSLSPGTSATPTIAKDVHGLVNRYKITDDDWDL